MSIGLPKQGGIEDNNRRDPCSAAIQTIAKKLGISPKDGKIPFYEILEISKEDMQNPDILVNAVNRLAKKPAVKDLPEEQRTAFIDKLRELTNIALNHAKNTPPTTAPITPLPFIKRQNRITLQSALAPKEERPWSSKTIAAITTGVTAGFTALIATGALGYALLKKQQEDVPQNTQPSARLVAKNSPPPDFKKGPSALGKNTVPPAPVIGNNQKEAVVSPPYEEEEDPPIPPVHIEPVLPMNQQKGPGVFTELFKLLQSKNGNSPEKQNSVETRAQKIARLQKEIQETGSFVPEIHPDFFQRKGIFAPMFDSKQKISEIESPKNMQTFRISMECEDYETLQLIRVGVPIAITTGSQVCYKVTGRVQIGGEYLSPNEFSQILAPINPDKENPYGSQKLIVSIPVETLQKRNLSSKLAGKLVVHADCVASVYTPNKVEWKARHMEIMEQIRKLKIPAPEYKMPEFKNDLPKEMQDLLHEAAATTTVDERINIGLKIASRLKYNGSAHQTQGLKLFTTSEGDCVTFASLFLAAAQLQDFAHYSDGYIVGGNGHAVVQITVGEKGKEFSFYVDNGGIIRDIPNYVSSNIGRKQGRNGELLGTNTGWFFPDSKFKNAQISAKHGGKYNDIPDDHLHPLVQAYATELLAARQQEPLPPVAQSNSKE
jgi:hypothetical protein